MAGNVYHSWNGTVLTITSDSGTSSCDLKGATGDTGIRGPQGIQGEKGEKGAGEKGDTGAAFTYDMFTPEQLAALTGPEGPTGKTGETGAPFTYDMFTEAQLESLRGPQGIQGKQGIQGEIGPAGKDGVGIPTGGTTGQILTKASAADYDTKWADTASGYAYNLLDNSDFTNPVNQRGIASGNVITNAYCIDRWKLLNVGQLTFDDGYITISANQGYDVYFRQFFEKLPKLPVTVRLETTSGIITATLTINVRYTFNDDMYVEIDGSGFLGLFIPQGKSLSIVNIALYEGSYTADTLPPYVPKGYAAELAECRRYYSDLGRIDALVSAAWGTYSGTVTLPTVMATASPTVIVKDMNGNIDNASVVSGNGEGTSIAIAYSRTNKSVDVYPAGTGVAGQTIRYTLALSSDL